MIRHYQKHRHWMTSPKEYGSLTITNLQMDITWHYWVPLCRRLPQILPRRWRFLRHLRFGSCPQRCRDGRGRAQGNLWEPKSLDFCWHKTSAQHEFIGLSMIFKVLSAPTNTTFGSGTSLPRDFNCEMRNIWSIDPRLSKLDCSDSPFPRMFYLWVQCWLLLFLVFQKSFSAWSRHVWLWAWKPMPLDGCIRLSSGCWFQAFYDSPALPKLDGSTWTHIFSMMIQHQLNCVLSVYL